MKGEIRDPTTVWLLVLVTGGLYALWWFHTIASELRSYLGRESLNPALDTVLVIGTCGLFGLVLPVKYGRLAQEAQRRAGLSGAEDQGVMFLVLMLLCGFGFMKMQEELNRVWEADRGAPAGF